jgi:hypothetical protein
MKVARLLNAMFSKTGAHPPLRADPLYRIFDSESSANWYKAKRIFGQSMLKCTLEQFPSCCVPQWVEQAFMCKVPRHRLQNVPTHPLHFWFPSKAAQSRSTAVDRDLSGSISAISVRR